MLHPEHILMPFDALLGHTGVDAIVALSVVLGGSTVYIPSVRGIFSKCIAQQILEEYDGSNIRQLALKYGYTTKHIYRLLNKRRASGI